MALQKPILIITVILFLIPVGIFIPTMMSETNSDTQTETALIELNNPHKLGNTLDVTLQSTTENDADIRLLDTETGESERVTISENSEYVYEFSDGNVSVKLQSIITDERVSLNVEYPATYGMSESEENMGGWLQYIIMLPLIIIILILLYSVLLGDE